MKPILQQINTQAVGQNDSFFIFPNLILCKGKGLDTCYCATYISQTRDQQRFTISEVAADCHEPMVPQRLMWPSIARANGQLYTSSFARKAAATSEKSTKHTTKTNKQKREKTTLKSGGLVNSVTTNEL